MSVSSTGIHALHKDLLNAWTEPSGPQDENGNYLFELPKMEKKSSRTAAQETQA